MDFIKEAGRVKPSQAQLDWFEMERYAFVHFSPNTYTGREWGDGTEDPGIFNPTGLDCDQWAQAIKKGGFRGMVLTAKHHDGFCLWPSAYTEHSVKNAPVSRDIVKEAAEACRRAGLKFGFYLSPWDRNSSLYGTDAYNDYYCNQLTELLTGYGEIFMVWFDNACGEGPQGKKQQYDFPRYFQLIRQHQPQAVIFNDYGPDVRWCGNESGSARASEWSVVPSELCHWSPVQTGPGPLAEEGDLSFLYNTHQEIGELSNILYSKGLVFAPSEIDMSIRPGWFWHPEEEPHSLERLFQTYLNSVGNNAVLHLNLPPNREGLLDEKDVKRLEEFSAMLKKEFSTPLAAELTEKKGIPESQPEFTITLLQPTEKIKYAILREDISKGQRVESFHITAITSQGEEILAYQGTCIGHKKICLLPQGPEGMTIQALRLHITAARGKVCLRDVTVC